MKLKFKLTLIIFNYLKLPFTAFYQFIHENYFFTSIQVPLQEPAIFSADSLMMVSDPDTFPFLLH